MIYLTLLMVTVFSVTQSAYGTQIDLKTRVAQQVERIKLISGHSQFGYGELPEPFPPDDSAPVPQLIKYGMDVIPDLVPYLADKSLTQACRRHSGGWCERARVNEYIILVINRITEHNFYLPPELSDAARTLGATVDPAMAKSIEELQGQINAWWRKNRTRTLLDRKIDDVNDPIHENRFSAYEWLGRTKAETGRLPLERRIDNLLTGEVNTLKQSEMAACAESVAKIGSVQSADMVRKVCDHLTYWVGMTFRPIGEGRAGLGSMQLSDLFKAHHALSSLGFNGEAQSRLQDIEMSAEMFVRGRAGQGAPRDCSSVRTYVLDTSVLLSDPWAARDLPSTKSWSPWWSSANWKANGTITSSAGSPGRHCGCSTIFGSSMGGWISRFPLGRRAARYRSS